MGIWSIKDQVVVTNKILKVWEKTPRVKFMLGIKSNSSSLLCILFVLSCFGFSGEIMSQTLNVINVNGIAIVITQVIRNGKYIILLCLQILRLKFCSLCTRRLSSKRWKLTKSRWNARHLNKYQLKVVSANKLTENMFEVVDVLVAVGGRFEDSNPKDSRQETPRRRMNSSECPLKMGHFRPDQQFHPMYYSFQQRIFWHVSPSSSNNLYPLNVLRVFTWPIFLSDWLETGSLRDICSMPNSFFDNRFMISCISFESFLCTIQYVTYA